MLIVPLVVSAVCHHDVRPRLAVVDLFLLLKPFHWLTIEFDACNKTKTTLVSKQRYILCVAYRLSFFFVPKKRN